MIGLIGQIVGGAAVNMSLKSLTNNFVKAIGNDELMKIGLKVERKAKQLCPVKTNRLRGSIHTWRIDWLTVAVGTNVEYAGFVEYGTRKQLPQPYLRPALLSQRYAIEKLGGKLDDVIDPTLGRLAAGGFTF